MSVLLETSLGDLVIDLEVERCPLACRNFLKLAKAYRYNYNAFFMVQKGFTAQTGDPSSSGKGGASIFNQLPEDSSSYCPSPYFVPEIVPALKHTTKGVVSFALRPISVSSARPLPGFTDAAISDEGTVLVGASQFFVTLSKEPLDYLDGRHAVFGKVVEDLDPAVLESDPEAKGTMDKINEAFTDQEYRPLRDIRIKHVVVLDDPFDDPEGLDVPSRTPSPTPSQLASIRLDENAAIEEEELDAAAAEEKRRKADTNAAALTLEMVGDLPFAEVRPPENILFVCKLNPVTRSEDLELLFSRFGTILSCEVIKDKKTGDSLQYAFIEFDRKQDAEQAYFKMQNVLIDDRRIWVDFSQSVSKLHGSWVEGRMKGRGGAKTGGAPRGGDAGRRGGDDGRERRGGTGGYERDRGYGGERRGYDDRRERDDGSRGGYRDERDGGRERERSPRSSREEARPRYRDDDRERERRSGWLDRDRERDRGGRDDRRHDNGWRGSDRDRDDRYAGDRERERGYQRDRDRRHEEDRRRDRR